MQTDYSINNRPIRQLTGRAFLDVVRSDPYTVRNGELAKLPVDLPLKKIMGEPDLFSGLG
jgi:hypothetical protein